MQVFYYCDGTEMANGPHAVTEIGPFLRKKILTPSSLVWRPGDEGWQELKVISEYKAIRTLSQKNLKGIPANWANWCKTGSYEELHKAEAVKKCLRDGQVRGYFSDIVLKPDLALGDSMYPSFEHLTDPSNHADAVVEARIINAMKSHLSEDEFWRVIEHLFIVGVEKLKIRPPYGKRLPRSWSPKRHYKKIVLPSVPEPVQTITVMGSPKVVAKGKGAKPK